jgi:hypothetical protein
MHVAIRPVTVGGDRALKWRRSGACGQQWEPVGFSRACAHQTVLSPGPAVTSVFQERQSPKLVLSKASL